MCFRMHLGGGGGGGGATLLPDTQNSECRLPRHCSVVSMSQKVSVVAACAMQMALGIHFVCYMHAGLEVLQCNILSLSWSSPLPCSLRTLSIITQDELDAAGTQPQLCMALRRLPALEGFYHTGPFLQPQLALLLASLQHSALLTRLDLIACNLTGFPQG